MNRIIFSKLIPRIPTGITLAYGHVLKHVKTDYEISNDDTGIVVEIESKDGTEMIESLTSLSIAADVKLIIFVNKDKSNCDINVRYIMKRHPEYKEVEINDYFRNNTFVFIKDLEGGKQTNE